MIKTFVTDYLNEHDVSYKILPHAEPVFTVEAAAAQRGVLIEEMVKSILLRERKKRRFVMACRVGNSRLDPQKVRVLLPGNWKRLSFATAEEIYQMTGYTKGSVSPLVMPKGLPIVFDYAIKKCRNVNISSGDPMAGLELRSEDLLRLVNPLIGAITET